MQKGICLSDSPTPTVEHESTQTWIVGTSSGAGRTSSGRSSTQSTGSRGPYPLRKSTMEIAILRSNPEALRMVKPCFDIPLQRTMEATQGLHVHRFQVSRRVLGTFTPADVAHRPAVDNSSKSKI